MNIKNTGCCAVNEITGLSMHRSALDAMRAFCKILKAGHGHEPAYRENYRTGSLATPYAHYLFTGVTETTDGCKIGYGPAFAAFILKHQLGTVIESVAESNRYNHPNHKVKVWVFTPNPPALREWFTKASVIRKRVKK